MPMSATPPSPIPTTPLEPPPGWDWPPARAATRRSAWARLEVAVASSCGRGHEQNEDAHSPLSLAGRLFVVADGVGGGAMAHTASRLLVARLHRELDDDRLGADRIRNAVQDADEAIARHIASRSETPGAATLALCAPANLRATRWFVAWVGDCRVYRIAAGGAGAQLLTRDDTFAHLGETPPPGSSADDPARMVGNGATTGANVALCPLAAGERLALCSDGVHKHVDAEALGRLLGAHGALASRCEAVLALARRRGSVDDATLMLVHHGGFAVPGLRWGVAR
jgi:serine/threonine protein phosphatase PrpC